MSKKGKGADSRQGSFLALLQSLQSAAAIPQEEGRLDVSDQLRYALVHALKECPLTRWEIAGCMSALIGREVTKYMLDAYTAESKDGHRFPAEYLPAFCEATGCNEPIRLLAQAVGMFALPGPEALRAEIQLLSEKGKHIREEKRKRELFLKEMEDEG